MAPAGTGLILTPVTLQTKYGACLISSGDKI
jgi:hypothetical protein